MVERTAVQTTDRAARLMRSAVLLAGLAAILFASYSLVAPLPLGLSYWRLPLPVGLLHWRLPMPLGLTHWRLPIVIATAGVLALLLAWPSRLPAARTRTADEVAAMLGVASAIVGIGAAMLVAIGVTLNFAENRQTTQAFIYQMTHPAVVTSLLAIVAPAAILGVLGLAITRRRGQAAARVSAAGVAVRFAAIGLGCADLIVALAAATALYRWVTWG